MSKFLIVGQGLAGTLLAHFLLKAKKNIKIIDSPYPSMASQVAAGIINPITGRRFAKSWRIEELLPFAKATYTSIENELQTSFFYKKNIIRALFSQKEENDWIARSSWESHVPYTSATANCQIFEHKVEPPFSWAEVHQSARIDLKTLITAYRNFFTSNKLLLSEKFDFKQLITKGKDALYKGKSYDKIIFCEGHLASLNPYFSYLPFNFAKGEVLMVRIPNAKFSDILKHRLFLVPYGDDLYWAGSNYLWDFEDDKASENGYKEIKSKIDSFLKLPYEIVEHKAAIRPTIKDRRPLLGLHPTYPQLAIFNGLGTKGSSLAPLMAKEMVDFLLNGEKLHEETNINRFESFS